VVRRMDAGTNCDDAASKLLPETISGGGRSVIRCLKSLEFSQSAYKPYLLNGEPLEVNTQVTVNFTLAE
jgi:hypothetical protein